MATITFHANNQAGLPSLIEHTEGSGLGFFGGGFGISVPVGEYQTATFVTNANGTASGVTVSNTKYDPGTANVFANSGCSIQGAGAIGNSGIPNKEAPLKISFEHDEAVRVQNCKLRIFNRTDIEQHANGVTTQVYEVRHPHPTRGVDFDNEIGPLVFRGTTGAHAWTEYASGLAMTDLTMTPGPGVSGLNTSADETLDETVGIYTNWQSNSGEAVRSLRHDWYVALSASPESIGSKTDFGLYFTLEYL